jgi:hypothetical protein
MTPTQKFEPFVSTTLVSRICCAGLLPLSLLITFSLAQDNVNLTVTGIPDDHIVAWQTQSFKKYQCETSVNLFDWTEIGVLEQGNDLPRSLCCQSGWDTQYYRIRVTDDPFLTLPQDGQVIRMRDGVSFAFNLNLFPGLPAKLRLYQRPWNTNAPWIQIGRLTDCIGMPSQRTVRGSAVWLPSGPGQFEVKAEWVSAANVVVHAEQRHITVVPNLPVTVTLVSGPPHVSASKVLADFATAFSVPEAQIRRVDFYDNGRLFATDREAPFGPSLKDKDRNDIEIFRGLHNITATAFDSSSVSGTSASYLINVTGGYARSNLTIVGANIVTDPPSPIVPLPAVLNVLSGQTFSIAYNVEDADGPTTISCVRGQRQTHLEGVDAVIDEQAPFEPLVFDTTGWRLGPHKIYVGSTDFAHEPPYLSFLPTLTSYPQYYIVDIVDGSTDVLAQALAENIADPVSAAPSNPVFKGVLASSQPFAGGWSSGLQLDNGIIMTTGKSVAWNGGDGYQRGEDNNRENPSEQVTTYWSSPGDAELLDRIPGRKTEDAACLEFDVFCLNGQLELEYQFGSEEFDEYVSRFNDGFLVTVDEVAVSLLPNGRQLAAVQTVNLNTNRPLFMGDDEDLDTFMSVNHPENRERTVEYDGVTVALKIHAFVTANQNHKIRIVISDISDPEYDSALFIQQGSLRTTSPQP